MDVANLVPTGSQGLTVAIVATVFAAGFRHGFDVDHIAAITDITSTPRTGRRSGFGLATMYALGHALVVSCLGGLAVLAGLRIPASVDALAGRLIGWTLIALGLYVLYCLGRYRRDFRMRSRWMLVTAGVRRVLVWFKPPRHIVIEHEHPHDHGHHGHHGHPHEPPPHPPGSASVALETKTHAHRHRHVVAVPPDPFTEYSAGPAFLIGMVHGVGAETPTQILLFTTAAGLAGAAGGLVVVGVFVAALLAGNTVLALLAGAGLSTGPRMPLLYMALAAVTAALSIYVGLSYLLERPGLLPFGS